MRKILMMFLIAALVCGCAGEKAHIEPVVAQVERVLIMDSDSTLLSNVEMQYDSKGRLVTCDEIDQDGTITESRKYSYLPNMIVETINMLWEIDSKPHHEIVILHYVLDDDGVIRSTELVELGAEQGHRANFRYRKGHVSAIMGEAVGTSQQFIWVNHNLIAMAYEGVEGAETQEYFYSDVKNNSNLDLNYFITQGELMLLKMAGMHSSNLVKRAVEGDQTLDFELHTDSDGLTDRIVLPDSSFYLIQYK